MTTNTDRVTYESGRGIAIDGRPTDAEYELADKLELALEGADARGLTPSAAARKARTDTATAFIVLGWMVREQYVHTSGNGCWTHYHAGRAR